MPINQRRNPLSKLQTQMDRKLINRILENGKKIATYYNQLQEKKISSKAFFDYHETLAIPGGLTHNLNMLKQADLDAISMAIAFLQANPVFFRSGYIKEQLLRILKKTPLSQEQIIALQEILLNEIIKAPARGYTDYCKLARAIQDDQFKEKVENMLGSTNNLQHKEKAKIMLEMMNSQSKTNPSD